MYLLFKILANCSVEKGLRLKEKREKDVVSWSQCSRPIMYGHTWKFQESMPTSNQIRVVVFNVPQLTQTSLQNVFLISVMLRWHRASVVCKNQSF